MNGKKTAKYYKEEQKINVDLLEVENVQILKCYEHFQMRVHERLSNDPCSTGFNFKIYVNNWIKYLRGELVYINEKDGIMVRSMGNYIKTQRVYKIIYMKIRELDIYVPLTIYEIIDHKKKFRLAKSVLKNKIKTLMNDGQKGT